MRTWPALDLGGAVEPDLLPAALVDFDVAAIDETRPDAWRVFFNSPPERDRAAALLRSQFPILTIAPVDVEDEDWAARSQADLRAVQVGRLIVAPPWDVPTVITIQPSTGFGTGHHSTTRLCLDALQRVDLQGRTALDVGTGSGVLAIAASLLGARDVTGIDDDPDAIQAAWENLALNTAAEVTLIVGDLRSTQLVAGDVVVANLTGALLVSSAERLRQLTTAHGRLILSGFTTSEERTVLDAYPGWSVEHRGEEEGWLCVTLLS